MKQILITSCTFVLAFWAIAIADSPGVTVGTTYYDFQSTYSSGDRMAIGSDGGKYFFWTNGLNYPIPRTVYFNYVTATGDWFQPGVGGQATDLPGSGFVQVALNRDDNPFYVYHGYATHLVVDGRTDGQHSYPPDSTWNGNYCRWPQIAINQNDYIYIVMTEVPGSTNDGFNKLYYTYSTDGGYNWIPTTLPIPIDNVMHPSARIAASRVSDRVVVAYLSPIDTASRLKNEVSYVDLSELDPGEIIAPTKITNYAHGLSSLWAFWDLDVIFDYNDNFHIVWTAEKVDSTGMGYPLKSYLYHYNSSTGQIHEIHYWPEIAWSPNSVQLGHTNLPICKVNLGVYHGSNQNAVFLTWTQFNTNDCSAGGYLNGDIFMSYSADGGLNWAVPTNLTNSISNGCFPGGCDSDNWASLADIVDDSLHIFYLDDKDAGSVVNTEGSVIENPMKYLAIRNPLVTGITDEKQIPMAFSLAQNYPNPFNSSTAISFTLDQETSVKLEVFDIAGREVQTLVNGALPAGNHRIIWEARDIPSGMYFYKLIAGDCSQTRKLILLK